MPFVETPVTLFPKNLSIKKYWLINNNGLLLYLSTSLKQTLTQKVTQSIHNETYDAYWLKNSS